MKYQSRRYDFIYYNVILYFLELKAKVTRHPIMLYSSVVWPVFTSGST